MRRPGPGGAAKAPPGPPGPRRAPPSCPPPPPPAPPDDVNATAAAAAALFFDVSQSPAGGAALPGNARGSRRFAPPPVRIDGRAHQWEAKAGRPRRLAGQSARGRRRRGEDGGGGGGRVGGRGPRGVRGRARRGAAGADAGEHHRAAQPQVDLRGRQGRRGQDHVQLQPGRAAVPGARERPDHLHRPRSQHLRRLRPEVLQGAHQGHGLRQPLRHGDRPQPGRGGAAGRVLRGGQRAEHGQEDDAGGHERLPRHRRGHELRRGHEAGEGDEFLGGGLRHGAHRAHAAAAQLPHHRGARAGAPDADQEPDQPLHLPDVQHAGAGGHECRPAGVQAGGDAARHPLGQRAVQGPGADHVHLRVHRRVPVAVRDGEADPGAGQVPHRHPQHRGQPARVPRPAAALPHVRGPPQDPGQVPGPDGGSLRGFPHREAAAAAPRGAGGGQGQHLQLPPAGPLPAPQPQIAPPKSHRT